MSCDAFCVREKPHSLVVVVGNEDCVCLHVCVFMCQSQHVEPVKLLWEFDERIICKPVNFQLLTGWTQLFSDPPKFTFASHLDKHVFH